MKKLLFLMIVAGGGAMLVKGNHVTITRDNQVQVMGWAVPLPAAVQSSPLMSFAAAAIQANAQPQPAAAAAAARTGTMGTPYRMVTSTDGTFNSNTRPAAGAATDPARVGDQFEAVARALRTKP